MPKLTQKQSPCIYQNERQFARIEQSNLMDLSHGELNSLILDIEQSLLFKRFLTEQKVICYNRLNKSDISKRFCVFNDNNVLGGQSPEVETLLLKKKNILDNIREIGQEKFKAYFLFSENGLPDNEIAYKCNITVSMVREINNLVNDITVMDEFYSTPVFNTNNVNYSKIATVEISRNGLIIGYLSPVLAKGRYEINYQQFETLQSSGNLDDKEIKKAKALFKKLEMINRCKESLHMILNNLIEKQGAYINSGNIKDILPLSQKEMAQKIGVSPSTISRAIKYRTIEIPCEKEITLKSLFPCPRKFKMLIIKKIIETETGLSSDAQIQEKLTEKFGVNISRRTVAHIRKELKIQPMRVK